MMEVDVTKAYRKTILISCEIVGNLLNNFSEEKKTNLKNVMVIRKTKTDFQDVKEEIYGFDSLEVAEEWISKQIIGEEITTQPFGIKDLGQFMQADRKTDISLLANSVVGFDKFYPMCEEIFEKAGVRKEAFGNNEIVADWLGGENINVFKRVFGENWTVVADLVYCGDHFETDTLVYRAAEVMFHYFISNDDAKFGYFCRDLELMKSAVEIAAGSGVKNANALAKATLAQRPRANERNEAMLSCIVKLWDELKNSLEGTQRVNFLKYNNIAAYEIRELAKQKRPPELLVKTSQKVKSERLIRKKISELKELEKI